MQDREGRAAILTVAAAKGGVGKTTISYELAASLGGVLVDLDHHQGGATGMWHYQPSRHRAPLLDALEAGPQGRPPRPRRMRGRPALVPSHRNLAVANVTDEDIADCLSAWARAWREPLVVVDTPPGDNPLADGAISVADLILVPVPLEPRSLDALSGMLEVFGDYQVVIVPNMVATIPPRRLLERLAKIVSDHDKQVSLAPWLSENLTIRRRLLPSALSLSSGRTSPRGARAVEELQRLSAYVARQLWGDEAESLTVESTLKEAS